MDVATLSSIVIYSHALAAACFAVLCVPLLRRRESLPRTMLGVAALLTVLWGSASALEASNGYLWSSLTDGFEILRSAGWSLFMLALLGNWFAPGSRLPFGLRPGLALAVLAYLLCLVANVGGYWNLGLLREQSQLPVVARLGMAIWGMLLVEQVYRSRSLQQRWAIKFACLGVGTIFAYDFYLYSHAMLFREVNPNIWAARGLVNSLSVPLLAISLGRSKSWNSPLALSRRAVFHSAALFGSAVYLLAMGFAGYYLRLIGGDWGTVMQVTFLFGTVILLGSILFSGTFRAWLKVFISKHFYRYNYDYREEWMRFTRTLSKPGPDLGQRVIEAVAALVESPGGVLWQRREAGSFEPQAHWQMPVLGAAEPADSPFASFLESSQWVVDLNEYESSPEKYDAMALPAWLQHYPRAWLVVPLIMHGRLSGFVVLQEARSPIKLNWEIIDLLGVAGSQAAAHLAQQEASEALLVARQFESFNRMSTFVVHDLKNLVAQLSLMNANAARHKDNPEFQADMLETIDFSVQKMKLLLQKLSRTTNAQERPVPLVVDEVVRQALALKGAFEPHPCLRLETPGLRVLAERERLERVVGHLIQNAIEATPKSGQVDVRVAETQAGALVEITDTGEGMSEEFIRERLFRPFDSTKSAGMGIGVFESREYIHELGGRLDVKSEPGKGTTFRIVLPPYRQETQMAPKAA